MLKSFLYILCSIDSNYKIDTFLEILQFYGKFLIANFYVENIHSVRAVLMGVFNKIPLYIIKHCIQMCMTDYCYHKKLQNILVSVYKLAYHSFHHLLKQYLEPCNSIKKNTFHIVPRSTSIQTSSHLDYLTLENVPQPSHTSAVNIELICKYLRNHKEKKSG